VSNQNFELRFYDFSLFAPERKAHVTERKVVRISKIQYFWRDLKTWHSSLLI